MRAPGCSSMTLGPAVFLRKSSMQLGLDLRGAQSTLNPEKLEAQAKAWGNPVPEQAHPSFSLFLLPSPIPVSLYLLQRMWTSSCPGIKTPPLHFPTNARRPTGSDTSAPNSCEVGSFIPLGQMWKPSLPTTGIVQTPRMPLSNSAQPSYKTWCWPT